MRLWCLTQSVLQHLSGQRCADRWVAAVLWVPWKGVAAYILSPTPAGTLQPDEGPSVPLRVLPKALANTIQ